MEQKGKGEQMLRLLTAGESHGKALTVIIEGLPADLEIQEATINRDLARRQKGYGRGGRMAIENDRAEVLSGIRGGRTLGSPLAMVITNRDYENWKEAMDPFHGDQTLRRVTEPRPGHADLAGALKYGFDDMRQILERSSARETAARVAAGSIARQLLEPFGLRSMGHVIQIGGVTCDALEWTETYQTAAEESPVRCGDGKTSDNMMKAIDQAKEEGDTLGGVVEVRVKGVPVGLGSHVHWDRKLDARLAFALMSIQGIRGVEIGGGFELAAMPGSLVHDEIDHTDGRGFFRKTNRAGGIEGGISNGEEVVIRCAMKPIPTLMKPLATVDVVSKEKVSASKERSDTCAVPAAAVVAEMVVLFTLAQEWMIVYGKDSFKEMKKCGKPFR